MANHTTWKQPFTAPIQAKTTGSDADTAWSCDVPTGNGRTRKLSLDGRVPLARVREHGARDRVHEWMRRPPTQKDSKRQNADIANASSAYVKSYLPCVVVLSNQIDEEVLRRYRAARWVVITGTHGNADPLTSTYDFMREVVGYDLAGFFERNAGVLQSEVARVLRTLLDSGRI